jgi:hypothetical protein
MLNGGVTRMGKTIFLLYLSTSIFLQNKGNVKMYISSAKLKDYYPFEGIPQVKMAKDTDGMIKILEEIIVNTKNEIYSYIRQLSGPQPMLNPYEKTIQITITSSNQYSYSLMSTQDFHMLKLFRTWLRKS